MKRFYTIPDVVRDYPYLIVPFHKANLLPNYKWKHVIVDTGVEIFAQGAKDYPAWFHRRYEFKAQQLTEIHGFDKIWFVIPDYPDDYRNNPIPHNVRRTLGNIETYHQIKDVNWVYPIQSDYMNMQSLHNSCHEVLKFNPQKVAIGTACKTFNVQYGYKACKMVYEHFHGSHIHIFGPSLTMLPKILPYIDSWDSSAWSHKQERDHMPRNNKERKEYFRSYLRKIDNILNDFYSQKRLN